CPALRFGERFITRVVALLALVSAARKQHADAPPPAPDPGYEEAPELPAEKAIRFYAAQRKPLRVRAITSLVVSLVLVWVSFGLPLAGALGSSVRVAALFCLAAECCVMLVGLDVVTHGITAFLQGSPNGESLIVFSCFTTALDALWTAIFGGGSRGLPFCAVSALSLSFALWGGEMYCAGLRTSMRALILGHNPSIITATRDPETGTKHLFKSHSDTEGFIRQSEETDVCEELASVTAPFLMIASLLLAFVASVLRGAPGDFFHVLGAMGAVCAPFSLLYAFPLIFSRCARRLLQIGVGIAGWSGVREFGGKTRLIITDSDVFPPNTIAIDSVRILEGVYTDRVISYAGSVLSAAGSGLAPLFTDLMRRNGYSMQQIDNFTICEGGIRALIRGEEVAIGANGFMNLCGLRIPRKLRTSNAVFISISGTLVGVFGIRYAAIPAVQDALVTLLRGKRSPIFAIRDFNVDPLLIRQKFKLSTEGFHFPSFAERYRLSSLEADKPRRYAAVLARSGLSPFVEAAERGSRLYRSTRFCAFLSLLCSVFGLLLMFLLCWNSSYESASAANLITYMMLWMIPLGVMHFWTRQ
ncbi:MAG: hypothetical protein Q4A39_04030, partial [Eubacteriales bacterium]|nr:hypothetical protein [Eubacteriales bacterium]